MIEIHISNKIKENKKRDILRFAYGCKLHQLYYSFDGILMFKNNRHVLSYKKQRYLIAYFQFIN